MIKDLISKSKKVVILAVIIALGLVGYHFAKKHQQKATQVAASTVLKPNEAEKIIINGPDHKITVVTPNGITTTNFSDNTVITEDKKLFLGVTPITYKKLDLNIGLETDCFKLSETALNISVGYNVHNATYLFLGVNNHHNIEGGLRFRF